MTRYKVTGEELRTLYSPETLLGRIFNDIERELQEAQLVVCRYYVNGMGLEERDELRFSQIPLSQVHELEYLAQTSQGIVQEVLEGWMDAIPELSEGAERLARRIEQGLREGLIKAVHDLVRNCQDLLESMESIQQIRADSQAMKGTSQAAVSLKKGLSEAVRHLETRNFPLLVQVLEYDLGDGLEECRRIVDSALQEEKAPVGDSSGQTGKDHSMGGGQTSD